MGSEWCACAVLEPAVGPAPAPLWLRYVRTARLPPPSPSTTAILPNGPPLPRGWCRAKKEKADGPGAEYGESSRCITPARGRDSLYLPLRIRRASRDVRVVRGLWMCVGHLYVHVVVLVDGVADDGRDDDEGQGEEDAERADGDELHERTFLFSVSAWKYFAVAY